MSNHIIHCMQFRRVEPQHWQLSSNGSEGLLLGSDGDLQRSVSATSSLLDRSSRQLGLLSYAALSDNDQSVCNTGQSHRENRQDTREDCRPSFGANAKDSFFRMFVVGLIIGAWLLYLGKVIIDWLACSK